jgi:hypothetical protein
MQKQYILILNKTNLKLLKHIKNKSLYQQSAAPGQEVCPVAVSLQTLLGSHAGLLGKHHLTIEHGTFSLSVVSPMIYFSLQPVGSLFVVETVASLMLFVALLPAEAKHASHHRLWIPSTSFQ